MRFSILELTEIPRDREKLKAVIGTARYNHRRSKLIRLTAYVMLSVAVLILLFSACSAPAMLPEAVYLPLVLR
jgi:hypothetical protein